MASVEGSWIENNMSFPVSVPPAIEGGKKRQNVDSFVNLKLSFCCFISFELVASFVLESVTPPLEKEGENNSRDIFSNNYHFCSTTNSSFTHLQNLELTIYKDQVQQFQLLLQYLGFDLGYHVLSIGNKTIYSLLEICGQLIPSILRLFWGE